jgi:hypothetical protein
MNSSGQPGPNPGENMSRRLAGAVTIVTGGAAGVGLQST